MEWLPKIMILVACAQSSNFMSMLIKLGDHVRTNLGDRGYVLHTRKIVGENEISGFHCSNIGFICDAFILLSQSHKMAWPFLEPVNADEVPEYYDVITDPIGESPQQCEI